MGPGEMKALKIPVPCGSGVVCRSTGEGILSDEYPDGIEDETLNDIFRYEGDTIAEWLGLKSEDYILQRKEASYLLSEAKDLLEQIREDNFEADFTLSDTEKFRKNTGMSEKKFVESGWKVYAANIEDISIEEVDEDYYEDTLEYIKLEVLDADIAGTIKAFKDRTRSTNEVFTPDGESMTSFRDRLTDKLSSLKGTLSRDDEDFADTLIDDINNCDDLCTGKKFEEEEEEHDDGMER